MSDLHAEASFAPALAASAPPQPSLGVASWLDYSNRSRPEIDPMRSLIRLVSERNVTADYLIVAGDICDKANGAALDLAWSELEELRSALNAKYTVATAGNHDLDSRYRSSTYDPKAQLLGLKPQFPLVDQQASAMFWGYGVAEFIDGETRFVLINSCAFHGGSQNEMNYGRMSPDMLQRLKTLASDSAKYDVNILLCHHHPYPFPDGSGASDDRIVGGEELLSILDLAETPWLVIHGHRHFSRVAYATGSSSSPAILAAASMSARIAPNMHRIARNQTHLITLTGSKTRAQLDGSLRNWTYVPQVGWDDADGLGGLPNHCGFGYRGSVSDLADSVVEKVIAEGGPISRERLSGAIPQLQYLTPNDLEKLRTRAESLNVKFVPAGASWSEVTVQ